MNSKTPLSNNTNPNSPNHYIDVNIRPGADDFGAVIVLFHWSLLIPTVAASYEEARKTTSLQGPYSAVIAGMVDNIKGFSETNSENIFYTKSFEAYLTEYFTKNKLFTHNSLDENLNSLANKSLVSVRTTIGDKIGTGRASITLENFDNQWLFQGTDPIFDNIYMEPIFMKGLYFTVDIRGRYDTSRYYRVFTGSVSSYSYSDNPNDRKITIEGKDLSKLLNYTRYNTHPSFWESEFTAMQGKVTIESNNLQDKTNIEIAKLVIPDIKDNKWGNPTDKYSLAAFKEMWQYPELSVIQKDTDLGFTDIVTRNYRKSYTTPSYNINATTASQPLALVWGDVPADNSKQIFSSSKPFSVYSINLRISRLRVSEFKTRAEILNEVAMLSFFSSFIDGSGNIHFHPPRYDYLDKNNKQMPILPFLVEGDNESSLIENPYIYVIDEDESVSENFSSSEDEVVTCLKVTGEMDYGLYKGLNNIDPTFKRPNIFWIDGGRRYGFRERKIGTAAFEDDKGLKAFALSAFIRLYLEIDKASVTIPLRPELEVDRPVYLPYKKRIYHIKSITHSYVAGGDKSPGDFSTSIECYAGRPVDHGTLMTTNIFRNIEPDKLLEVYNKKGFKLSYDMFGDTNAKKS